LGALLYYGGFHCTRNYSVGKSDRVAYEPVVNLGAKGLCSKPWWIIAATGEREKNTMVFMG
jgi:hypothetical protein